MGPGLPERLDRILARIARHCEACGRDPASVELLPVSKKQPDEKIRAMVALGRKALGENRVQELAAKAGRLGDLDVEWHMVGSLQTNKVKQMLQVPNLAMLQSLDRIPLADSLQKALEALEAPGPGRSLPVLLQVDATGEARKHGCPPADVAGLVEHLRRHCPGLELRGLMAMGPLHRDPAPVFRQVARLRSDLRESTGLGLPVLSMGMTGDLAAAITAGSTMVRVGTGVFGPRNPQEPG